MSLNWGSLPQEMLEKVNQIMMELKAHSPEAYSHCVRVSQLCRFLAEHAELNSYQQLLAQFSGLLHDVGKMKTPKEILNKPDVLTDDEYNIVKIHPIQSAEILEPLESSSFFREVQVAILHHHERMDGRGYPYGLEGEQIPLISRLVLIVDTVDAMTHARAYRPALSIEDAYSELRKHSGNQFDPEFVSVFIEAHQKAFEEVDDNKVIVFPSKIRVA